MPIEFMIGQEALLCVSSVCDVLGDSWPKAYVDNQAQNEM
jgi:hypothetical protein